ncbi:HCNGP family protein [Toxoplasma gondii TgCatPRC2]|uniref:HCNGP family protein n=5 Tax=Toxoplasma gondii TaxID=5811 RepID=B6KTY8_TOXGV|nr:HCNGP family protein [Toxoplasma gondii ME49]EPT24722.1 HCNGP family protein [Toxoplasma gondii ME49]ESS34118.1 HCNGP family protein [Toxoplasma gondii VEG]KYK67029.1 HCNGP family protein [Toxoplasma gondii TgCatPRC2]CEL78206.1 TPA: HCNGP family protein [Toxoplasma gondii VEG]|eukprot:XP_002371311.1 HCNGP family protein [Toxoplasma gondii ME49]
MSLVDYGFYSDEEEDEPFEAGDGQKRSEAAKEAGESSEIVGGDVGLTPPPAAASRRSVSSLLSARGLLENSAPRIDYDDMEDGPSIEKASDPADDSDSGVLPKADRLDLRARTALSASGDLTDSSPVDGSLAVLSNDEATQQTSSGVSRAHGRQMSSGLPPTAGHVSLMPQVPAGDVPQELLRTVERLQQLKKRGITVNGNIAASLDFKNPYLLEKIMKVFDIDPYCSNYPPSVFDPASVTPWKPEGGSSFEVQLMRRFESRRQTRRVDSLTGRETDRATPPLSGSVPTAPLAVGSSASTTSANVVPLSASSSSEFILGPTNGSVRRNHNRSGLERISPPASLVSDPTGPASASAAASSAVAAAAQLTAVIQQAALKAAAAQAGAVASSLQQQLQQRLLSSQTGFSHQKPLLEAQTAAAARNHVGGQLNGPGGVTISNFTQQRPGLRIPSPSGATGHSSETGWTSRADNEGDANAKKRPRDAGTGAFGTQQTS